MQQIKITFDSAADRNYYIYRPTQTKESRSPVVIVAFHGGGSNGPLLAQFSGLNTLAEETGCWIVYPSGTGHSEHYLTWNAGACCGVAAKKKVRDLEFVETLLEDLSSRFKLQSPKIFATGMSNGGMMCYRLATELSHRFLAVASVAGAQVCEFKKPKQPISILHFHGTEDCFVPFTGGKGSRSIRNQPFLAIEKTISSWRTSLGCNSPIQVSKKSLQEKNILARVLSPTDKEMPLEVSTAINSNTGAEVTLAVIHNGGHTWPGQAPNLCFLGRTHLSFSANRMMWHFFQNTLQKRKM